MIYIIINKFYSDVNVRIFQKHQSIYKFLIYCFDDFSAQIAAFRGELGAPVIEPYDPDITYQVNTDQKIECKGKSPVTWWAEDILLLNRNLKITQKEMPDQVYRYYTYLDFNQIFGDNVGRYYCVFTEHIKDGNDIEHYEEEVQMNFASSIYIFVDGEHFKLNENSKFIQSQLTFRSRYYTGSSWFQNELDGCSI